MTVCAVLLCGCLPAMQLNRTVMAYDAIAADAVSKQLLLNIARAVSNEPLHFTALSNVTATFNFQMNAGATPPLGGVEGGLSLAPILGGSWSDNPTFSIVPVEGEEFTRRLLTPFPESTLTLLLRQGADIDLLLRLMAAEYRTELNGQKTYYNKPLDREGYSLFRRVVLHLSSIQDRSALYVEPLIFQQHWTMPTALLTPAALQTLAKEFSVTPDAGGASYRLSKRTLGRIIITNYDPEVLSNDELMRLNNEAEENLDDELVVDIRPGYTGGEYPLHGKFTLRSFSNAIGFIGRGVTEEPEYEVSKDSRTPAVNENPVSTMGIAESNHPPWGPDRVVRYHGHYYALRPQSGYQWNKKAFLLLYQLFQMTVVKLPSGSAPSITISK